MSKPYTGGPDDCECDLCGKEFDKPVNKRIHRSRAHDLSFEERFWEKVDRGDPDECWEWQAGSDPSGYGTFSVKTHHEPAHRVAYSLAVEDADDLLVLHHCDNPPCCNPNHLYAGTHKDNIRDVVFRERSGQVILTVPDVREIKRLLENGESSDEIAEDYDVRPGTIDNIRRGDNWSYIDLAE